MKYFIRISMLLIAQGLNACDRPPVANEPKTPVTAPRPSDSNDITLTRIIVAFEAMNDPRKTGESWRIYNYHNAVIHASHAKNS